MPFSRKAQRRKFAELLMKGEISEEVYEERNRSTGTAQLPERVTPKAKRKGAKNAKSVRSRKTAKRSAKGRSKKAPRKRRTR